MIKLNYQKKILEKGTVLIISSIILVLLLILSVYFLTFTLTEFRISKSEIISTQTYYLAEAGVNEAIWKLKHDPDWKINFETEPGCYTWGSSFERAGIIFSNDSYQIQVQNSDCARGQIIATSTIALADGKIAQRVIKTKVFKSTGSFTGDSAIFTGGTSENIDVNSSIVNIHNGNIFSNSNFNISWFSDFNIFDNLETEDIEGKVLAVGNINVSWSSSLNSTATCAKNICQGNCLEEGCPPESLSAPMIDFDSEDENSYKNKAIAAQENNQCSILCNEIECSSNCLLTDEEFEELLWQVGEDGTLTLNNDITYITGPIELRGGRQLVVNGALVADGTINIGERNCWTYRGQKDCGCSQITIYDPGVDRPSGLLTKAKMNIGSYSSFQDIEITGLIYAIDEIRIVSLPWSFTLTGGIITRKFSLTSAWASFNIYLDDSIIAEGIWGGVQPPDGEKPPYSPIVTVEHWEEAY